MRILAAGVLVFALGTARAAGADEDGSGSKVAVHGVVDARAVATDVFRSWLDGGLGKTRYGPPVASERAFLLKLSQLSLVVDASAGDFVSARVQLNGEADGDPDNQRNRVDVIQGFVEVRGEPSARVRVRGRAGVFFPPVSMEADEVAWTGPYTITPSAATSWIADEVRIIGAEARVSLRPEKHELALSAAAFGGNDPTGSLLAWRGWAMGDRQTGLGDRLPLAPFPSIEPGGVFEKAPRWVQPFREIDGRVGYYVAGSYQRVGVLELRAIFYDNLGEPTVFDGSQYAWHTRFSSVAGRVQWRGLSLLGQYLAGDTRMGRVLGGHTLVDNGFWTAFGMASLVAGRHRLSARYEEFRVNDNDVWRVQDPNDDCGRAYTGAYSFKTGELHRLAIEVVHIDSKRLVRVDLGQPERAQETIAQASFRVRF